MLAALLPPRQSIALSKLEPYGFFIVLILVTTGVFTRIWLGPLVGLGQSVLAAILNPIASLFF